MSYCDSYVLLPVTNQGEVNSTLFICQLIDLPYYGKPAEGSHVEHFWGRYLCQFRWPADSLYALLNFGPWIIQNLPNILRLLSESYSFHLIFTKLVLAKLDDQSNSWRHLWIMALELAKNGKNKPCPLFNRSLIQSSLNLLWMFMVIKP